MIYDTILEQITDLGLQIGEYVVYGSGPLGVRGLRETDDIDVCVLRSVRKRLIDTGKYTVIITKYGNESFVVGNMEVAYTIPGLSFDEIDLAVQTPDIINGVTYLSLDYTKQSKGWMNREKDITDLALIDVYLANH